MIPLQSTAKHVPRGEVGVGVVVSERTMRVANNNVDVVIASTVKLPEVPPSFGGKEGASGCCCSQR